MNGSSASAFAPAIQLAYRTATKRTVWNRTFKSGSVQLLPPSKFSMKTRWIGQEP
jgi:hypothetical protein